MTNNITEEELQKAIVDAVIKSKPGFKLGETTAPAEGKKHNINVRRAAKILSHLCDEGFLEKAKITFIDDWGDRNTVKGYRVKGDLK